MKASFILLIFFSTHVKSRDITRILKSCDISAVSCIPNTCALLMKFPVLTCLKIFVSNTLFTSSLKILDISTCFCF